MSKKTHAQIIAEMNCGPIPEHRHDREILRLYAHELDAAHKREMVELRKQVGNAAKLREALVSVQKKIHYLIGSLNVPNSLVANRMEINGIINAALAEPPRNCDKYPTFNDAIRALADKRGWHDAKWDSERYCILAQWLYAPATEKEGGNNGK